MSRMGRNWKWIIAPDDVDAVGRMLMEAFGATEARPMPTLRVYTLPSGENVGVFADTAALSPAAARQGAWLELLVADPAATGRTLDALGVPRVEYSDRSHAYFQAPGGPVFRLAPL